MAIGDIFEFDLRGNYAGQETHNIFYYRQDDAPDDTLLVDKAQDFWVHINPSLLAVTNEDMVYDQVIARLVGSVDFAVLAINSGGEGDVSGDGLPPHDCWAFRYNRATGLTRHGQKRFAGVSESQIVNSGNPASGVQTLLNALATALGESLTGLEATPNNPYSLDPVIMSFTINGQPRVTPVYNNISSVSYVRVSTQNTRKVYR